MVATTTGDSLLQAINRCHNHDPWTDSTFVKVVYDPAEQRTVPARQASAASHSQRAQVIGFVPQHALQGLASAGIVVPEGTKQVLGAAAAFVQARTAQGPALFLYPPTMSYEARTEKMATVSNLLRTGPQFPHVAAGWRNELYSVYGPSSGEKLFSFERAACSLFGFATFGVHATGYTKSPDSGFRFWVPRRSSTKQTWPGMLDNTAAGGLAAGERRLDAMVRECEEEAGLPAELVRSRIRSTGTLTYFYLAEQGAGGTGFAQPEVQYIYDLEIPLNVKPHPVDGEAEDFQLMSTDQVLDAIRSRRFKPNCALVFIDFFLRHGLITPESERDYALLVPRLHADLGLPLA